MKRMLSYSDAVKYRPACVLIEKKATFLEETEELFRKIKNYDGSGFLTIVRQFSCKNCLKCWWKRVRSIKQVSTCNRCKVRYDPIPISLEFGYGVFHCSCSNKFSGRAQMGQKITCFKCKQDCFPLYITRKKDELRKAPEKENIRNVRKFNKHLPNSLYSSYRRILAFSRVHESTGSTQESLSNQLNLDVRFIDDYAELDVPSILDMSTDDDESSFFLRDTNYKNAL